MQELICKVQAILFASGDYVSFERLQQITGATEDELRKAIAAVDAKFSTDDFAIHIQNEGEAWKFAVRKKFLPTVEQLFAQTELTKSVMETLAVIAWKDPIMQSDLVKIRSNKAYDHIAELVEKGFILKEKSGRTYAIKLTQKFYNYFDVSAREDVQKVFSEIERGVKNKALLPQKKVIDFDGKPRAGARLDEGQLRELNILTEEERLEQEQARKQEQQQEIASMRSSHSEILTRIDDSLSNASQRNVALVREFEDRKHEEKPVIDVEDGDGKSQWPPPKHEVAERIHDKIEQALNEDKRDERLDELDQQAQESVQNMEETIATQLDEAPDVQSAQESPSQEESAKQIDEDDPSSALESSLEEWEEKHPDKPNKDRDPHWEINAG